jgi:hypothetical protein
MKSKLFIIILFLAFHFNLAPAQDVKISIDAKKNLGKVHELFFGLNVARWDESLFPSPAKDMLLTCDRNAIKKVSEAKFKLLKYPGGNDADAYIWNDPHNNESEMDTDEFAAFCKALGAEGFITINFNQPASLAAEWVKYCNIKNNYNIKYWEVGDEQWGDWAKGHTTPEEYAKKYIEFVKAMKAIDPTIKVAINVKMENDPDGWTIRSLKAAKDYVDLITITFYPVMTKQDGDEKFVLSTPKTFIKPYLDVKDAVKSVFPKEKWDSLWVIPVGYNTVTGRPGAVTVSIVNALWTADLIGIMANLGVEQTDYWALHNAYPPRGGDYGLLTSDSSNTPHYNYYALKIMAEHLKDQMIEAISDDSLMSVYASKDLIGNKLSLFLINKNKTISKNILLNINNFEPSENASVWVLNEKEKEQKKTDFSFTGNGQKIIIEPYTLKVIELESKDYKSPAENLALKATATASSYSIIGPNFLPKCANDGIRYTRWRSESWITPKPDGNEHQWLLLEFDKIVDFNFIKIYWDYGYATDYSISCSIDGKVWNQIISTNNGKGDLEEYNFTLQKAKYVKIIMEKGKKAISTYNIEEIEIYNQ